VATSRIRIRSSSNDRGPSAHIYGLGDGSALWLRPGATKYNIMLIFFLWQIRKLENWYQRIENLIVKPEKEESSETELYNWSYEYLKFQVS
jgi:hypothetical protein